MRAIFGWLPFVEVFSDKVVFFEASPSFGSIFFHHPRSIKNPTPGDSKWPFHPLIGGHLTIEKGHLTIPKRSLWITRCIQFPKIWGHSGKVSPPKLSEGGRSCRTHKMSSWQFFVTFLVWVFCDPFGGCWWPPTRESKKVTYWITWILIHL